LALASVPSAASSRGRFTPASGASWLASSILALFIFSKAQVARQQASVGYAASRTLLYAPAPAAAQVKQGSEASSSRPERNQVLLYSGDWPILIT